MARRLLFTPAVLKTRLVCLVSTCAIVGWSAQARAEVPDGLYVGARLGANIVLDDWDLAGDADIPPRPGTSPYIGLYGGYQLFWWLAAEGGLGFLPNTIDHKANLTLSYTADALISPLKISKKWTPFIDVGFGAYHNVAGSSGRDIDYHVHWGLGVRGMMLDWLALRADARHMITDGRQGDASANNIELTVGVDIWPLMSGESKSDDDEGDDDNQAFVVNKSKDSDGDGINDDEDDCPKTEGSETAGGCPDTDADGVADADDLCPDEAGSEDSGGCADDASGAPVMAGADSDGDGIADGEDACPDVKGTSTGKGCPDRDGDSVLDRFDDCPVIAGTVEANGCPDKDGDGVADRLDRCPNKSGQASAKGCPDADGDGIRDSRDKCPEIAGVAEKKGCLPKEVGKTFAGRLKGIRFKTGSATIRKSSKRTLRKVIRVLKKFKSMRVRIEGHADSTGSAEKNQELSDERALAVKAYLVARGIDKDRLETKGFGQDKPIASNQTSKGRAQNRCIEFKIIGK